MSYLWALIGRNGGIKDRTSKNVVALPLHSASYRLFTDQVQ